jgi:hypothetical protein
MKGWNPPFSFTVKVHRDDLTGLAELFNEKVGYKVQVAESLPEEDSLKQKRFITSIVTQKAIASDDPGLDETFRDQAVSGLGRPTELYVDGAYV